MEMFLESYVVVAVVLLAKTQVTKRHQCDEKWCTWIDDVWWRWRPLAEWGFVWGFSGFGGVVRNPPLPFCGTPKFFALAFACMWIWGFCRALICKTSKYNTIQWWCEFYLIRSSLSLIFLMRGFLPYCDFSWRFTSSHFYWLSFFW